jgi:hypothetical protein
VENERTKTLNISDDAHKRVTVALGTLMTQTNRMQTYRDAINALINESAMLPPELLTQAQSLIEENKQLGFATKEEFIRDEVRFRLTWLKSDRVYVPKEEFDLLDQALGDEYTLPQCGRIHKQTKQVLQKYQERK